MHIDVIDILVGVTVLILYNAFCQPVCGIKYIYNTRTWNIRYKQFFKVTIREWLLLKTHIIFMIWVNDVLPRLIVIKSHYELILNTYNYYTTLRLPRLLTF